MEAEIKKQEVEAQSRQAELDDLYSRAIGEMETGHWEEAVGLFVEIQEREPGFCETEELLAQAVSKLKTTVGEWIAPASGEVRLFGGVEMVYVPAGPFLMGSEDYADQKPRHEVDVSGFWIDRTPVTNEEYRRFVEATGHTKPTHWVSSRIPEGKESHPVTHVSWQDAQAYCRWRSGRAGVEIRLPSEAEWEKAARGIGGRRYPWGNKLFGRKPSPRVSDLGGTRPVGHGSPAGDSPYGVADMAGNVWEWTGSLYKPYPYDQADGREELESGGRRVLRGGSWRYDERYVRAANRFNYDPSYSDDYIGFRCACSDSER